MTFCLFELYAHSLTFSFLLPSVVLELSEMKIHVKSVAGSGRESLGALETVAKWAQEGPCCVCQA